eukprot:TRINITY_DN6649_c0_g1_i1.p1 TRINITY_DN6649_c0_g1~~TRINITY_DN6649_c0_g1_i1.p1  ORF type:complete len:220 (+),score=27.78 TRINITY_DN6649_c0_g1_i1:123-782(+)
MTDSGSINVSNEKPIPAPESRLKHFNGTEEEGYFDEVVESRTKRLAELFKEAKLDISENDLLTKSETELCALVDKRNTEFHDKLRRFYQTKRIKIVNWTSKVLEILVSTKDIRHIRALEVAAAVNVAGNGGNATVKLEFEPTPGEKRHDFQINKYRSRRFDAEQPVYISLFFKHKGGLAKIELNRCVKPNYVLNVLPRHVDAAIEKHSQTYENLDGFQV